MSCCSRKTPRATHHEILPRNGSSDDSLVEPLHQIQPWVVLRFNVHAVCNTHDVLGRGTGEQSWQILTELGDDSQLDVLIEALGIFQQIL